MKLFKEDTHNIKIQNFVTTFQITLTIFTANSLTTVCYYLFNSTYSFMPQAGFGKELALRK